mmetsp:Transcript_11493/g.13474  ORF Transcript_11493/g.13474 Transcript_11493/m.13474 type:complete len:105 (+) Transcript_11493:1-315(+)
MYFFRKRMPSENTAFEHGSAQEVAQAHQDPDQLASAIAPSKGQEGAREIAEDVEVAVVEQGASPSMKPLSGMERVNMLQMAAFSGVAIALHNFPEGLATFVGAF